MVSKASDDLPEPESPVITTSRSRGISRSIFLRLCSRAPLMTILSAMLCVPRRRRAPRVVDRRNHAARVGLAAPGDIVGGAVIGRGTDKRQPERDIHGAIKLQSLERDQALVVVHRDRRVEGELPGGPDEGGIGRERTARVNSVAARTLD